MRLRLMTLVIIGSIVAASGGRAHAIGWNLRLEGGVALPADDVSKSLYSTGGGAGLRGGIEPLGWLDLHLTLGYVGLAAHDAHDADWNVMTGGGVRLLVPRDRDYTLFPWLDGEALYVRNNVGNHAGFSVGGGLVTPVDGAKSLFVGIFLRYLQVVNSSAIDSKTVIVGLDIEYGSPHHAVVATATPPRPIIGDRDGDGVRDDRDRCPDQAGPASNDGCPRAVVDSDDDGVPDDVDACPHEAGPADRKGCPVKDRDHDGVADDVDACPEQAGPAALQGCPDSDGDGVADRDDNCPNKAGTVENHGCPVYKSVTVTKGKLEIAEKIFFANNSAKILPRSFPILDEVAKVLGDNGSVKLRVEGHTDATGKAARNQVLSEQRAAAVRDYLVKKGVAGERLESKGYGSTVPVADNATAEGRDQNRRVDFVVTSR